MRIDEDGGQDVRTLLGMQTKPAWAVVGFYSLTFVLIAGSNTTGVRDLWLVALAVLITTAGAVGLITVPGDPIPMVATLLLTGVGPVCSVLVLWQLPVPGWIGQQAWPSAAACAIYTFMCVRGRTLYAWIGMTALVAVFGYWTATTGQGVARGISQTAINYAPLLMSTVFAYTIRPVAKSVFELRRQATMRAAAEAASIAILDERDRQLDGLDELARPILELIASGAILTRRQQLDCRLLEAQLRDTLRAHALAGADVVASARAARSKGVQVVMLDDHGMDATDPSTQDRIRRTVAHELDQIDEGTVTVRIQPPGRPRLATILVDSSQSSLRLEIDHQGNIERQVSPSPIHS